MDPAYSWNKQLAHTPFPKKIKTPSTTLRFIRFVAKISVLNPKLPADGQWPKETKESVTFFIWSPRIDRLKNRTEFFLYYLALFIYIAYIASFRLSKSNRFLIRFRNHELPPWLQPLLKTKKGLRTRTGRMKASWYANSSSANQPFPWVIFSTNK